MVSPWRTTGYDLIDNDGDHMIDNQKEWGGTANLGNHTHNTARAEMLYAVLVEGSGPWGSVFSTAKSSPTGKCKIPTATACPSSSTPGASRCSSSAGRSCTIRISSAGQIILPDPTTTLQWDLIPPYQSANTTHAKFNTQGAVFQERDVDPLDQNQQLVAPAWWASTAVKGELAANGFSLPAPVTGPATGAAIGASGGVQAFEYYFHRLTEPFPHNGASTVYWDRGGVFPYRRAFYTKFLILSGGPDKQPGVFLYADHDMKTLGASASYYLIANENNALPFALDLLGGGTAGFTTTVSVPVAGESFTAVPSNDPTRPSSYDLQQAAQDDITNHNLQTTGGIGGSG